MFAEVIMCLALNVYHEARGEKYTGQVAVSEVVRTRMEKSTWPNDGCAVVWQRKQFSWTIGYKAKNVNIKPYYEGAVKSATTNYSNGADHYHTIDIIPPDWADDMEVVQVIGNHIFYRSNYE